MHPEKKFNILVAVFVMALTLSALIGSKIISVFGLVFSASALTFPLTFLVTDVVSEVWGKRRAKHVVHMGLIALIFAFLIATLAVALPGAGFWENQEAYAKTLGVVGRIVLAGTVAYLMGQYHDLWAFHLLRKLTRRKHLWLRNNVSTMISQFIDTTVFISVGFFGILPTAVLIPTIVGHWFAKVLFAAADTPFIYLVVRWARGRRRITTA